MATAASFDESPEYETLRECYPVMRDLLKSSIAPLGSELFAHGLIPLNVYENIPESRTAESTHEVLTHLMNLVRHNPATYNKLVVIIENLGPWTDTILENLRETYAGKQLHTHSDTSSSQIAADLNLKTRSKATLIKRSK